MSPDDKTKINTITIDKLIQDVIDNLSGSEKSTEPPYTIILGAGFSFGLVPTVNKMLDDILWWCFGKGNREQYEKPELGDDEFKKFRITFWENIQKQVSGNAKLEFKLNTQSLLPDKQEDHAKAYQALMNPKCSGLFTPDRRRRYLCDVIRKSGHKLNEAHLYLAGILREQWKWDRRFCKTIFTTNFDHFLQKSLQLANQLYFMSDQPDSFTSPIDDAEQTIHLFYAHGSIHRYLLCNNTDEINKARDNAQKLVPYLQQRGVIVIGYGGWDDVLMKALATCPQFQHNLYWCGYGKLEDQSNAVQDLLHNKNSSALYVQTNGADDLMEKLYRALNGEFGEEGQRKNPVPQYVVEPLADLINQFESCKEISKPKPSPVKYDSSGAIKDESASVDKSLGAVLKLTVENLKISQKNFKDSAPSVSKQMQQALLLTMSGQSEKAIEAWTKIIDRPDAPAEQKVKALVNRGVAKGQDGDTQGAIADYTTVIDMVGVPADRKAKALFNRGVTKVQNGDTEGAIADYTAVIDMPDAPTEQKAQALVNRGATKGQDGDIQGAIADYTVVIDMVDVSAEQKANALYNRGVVKRQDGDIQGAIADYTVVIDMVDVSAEQKAQALVNRGVAKGRDGDSQGAIADCTAMIDMADAPAEPKVKALINRGVTKMQDGDTQGAIADYTAVIDMPDASAEQKAHALVNRGVAKGLGGDNEGEIADYTAVIDMVDAPAEQKAKALYNRGATKMQDGDTQGAIADYSAVIDMVDTSAEQKAKALVNRGITKRQDGDTEGAIADYVAVIDMVDAPTEQKAKAYFNLACLEAMREDVEACLGYLKNSIEIRPLTRKKLDEDSDFDPVRDDERFRAFRESLSDE